MNEKYQEQMDRIVELASWMSKEAKEPVCKAHPQLRSACRFNEWELFTTSLALWTMYSDIDIEIPKQSRAAIKSVVQSRINAWHPFAFQALKHLEDAILRCQAFQPDPVVQHVYKVSFSAAAATSPCFVSLGDD